MDYSIKAYISSFLNSITLQQLEALHLGHPDNASTILLMEMILNLILGVTESVVKHVMTMKEKNSVEKAGMLLKKSLFHNLCDALGVPKKNASVRILYGMIYQEINENTAFFLIHAEMSKINIQIPPFSKLNKMAALFIELFKYSGKGISCKKKKWRKNGRKKCKSDAGDKRKLSGRPEEAFLDTMLETSVQNEVRKTLSGILASLLNDVSECFYQKVQDKMYLEIQSLPDDPSSLLDEDRKKIQSFYSKWFLKLWLCRMVQQLNSKYPKRTKTGTVEAIDAIIEGLTSANVKQNEPTNLDYLLMMFTNMPCDRTQDFTDKLRDLVIKHVLVEKNQELICKDFSQSIKSFFKPEGGIDIDIWRDAQICIAMINWFHNSQTERIVQFPCANLECEINESIPREEEEDEDLQRRKFYIFHFVEKVVFYLCSQANVMVENLDDLLNCLFERVWPEVKEEKIYVTHKTFKNLGRAIQRELYKKYGLVEVMYFMEDSHPVFVEFLISFIRRKLATKDTNESQNQVRSFLSAVGSHLKSGFKFIFDKLL